jgi:hypothetical protein
MALLRFVLVLTHAGVAAVWLGAMAYSLAVVQPRAARLLGPERYEQFAAVVADGARWAVLGMCGVLAATGFGLVAVALAAGHPGPGWLALATAKTVVLCAALTVFAHVSWRLWPRRVFALPRELPALHRAFRRAALTLVALVGAELVLGVAASTHLVA